MIRWLVMPQDISVKYYQKSIPKDISVSTTSYHNHHFPKHFHDHYTIQFIIEGVNEGFTESNKYKIGKNGLLIINPGEIHAGNSLNNKALKFHSIRLGKKFLKNIFEQNRIPLRGGPYFKNQPIYCSKLSGLTQSLISNLILEDRLGIEFGLSELLMELIQNFSQRSIRKDHSKQASINSARDFLNDNFNKNLTLEQISEVSHLSPYHFLRQFKKQFGLSPLQYLRNIRVEKAKTLIPHYSISQVAHQVGFYDHSHFLRFYKNIEGTTPSNRFNI